MSLIWQREDRKRVTSLYLIEIRGREDAGWLTLTADYQRELEENIQSMLPAGWEVRIKEWDSE